MGHGVSHQQMGMLAVAGRRERTNGRRRSRRSRWTRGGNMIIQLRWPWRSSDLHPEVHRWRGCELEARLDAHDHPVPQVQRLLGALGLRVGLRIGLDLLDDDILLVVTVRLVLRPILVALALLGIRVDGLVFAIWAAGRTIAAETRCARARIVAVSCLKRGKEISTGSPFEAVNTHDRSHTKPSVAMGLYMGIML